MTSIEAAWIRGFSTALAEMHRLLLHGNNSSGVCRIAREAGVSLNRARKAGVVEYDIAELAKAGVD